MGATFVKHTANFSYKLYAVSVKSYFLLKILSNKYFENKDLTVADKGG